MNMTKQQQLIGTRRQLADMLGLSERRITELIKIGVIPARGPAGFDLVASVRAYIAFLKSEPGDMKAEKLRYAKIKSDLLHLDLEQRTGELVLASEVKAEVFRLARQSRDILQNIPPRWSGILTDQESDQTKIFAILTKAINDALEGICNGTQKNRVSGPDAE